MSLRKVYYKIKKVYSSFGIWGFLKKLFIRIITDMGLIESITFFYSLNLSSYVSKLHKGTLEKFIVKTIVDIKDIDSAQLIELKKMNYDPIEKYLKKGAEIDLVINYNGDIIGYNCIQFGRYTQSWGVCYLGHDEAWIGPAFVKRSYRNMGIHSEITQYGLKRLKKRGFKRVVTSVNSRNIPSIRTFTRIGFSRTATIKVRRFFGKTLSKKQYGNMSNFDI